MSSWLTPKRTVGFALLVAALFVIYAGAIMYALPSWSQRGTFGDMFGALNALLSGFALIGVIVAIALQQRELQLQRQELEMTRTELRRTADAQERSQEALGRQAAILERTARINALTGLINTGVAALTPSGSALRNSVRHVHVGDLTNELLTLLREDE